jgi:hypothetical protein
LETFSMGERVTDPDAIREALRSRRGGTAVPWEWQVSHSWFTLRVEHPRLAGNLHLVCGACDRVEFDARLLDCDVQIEEPGAGLRFRVIDSHRLLVVCGLLHVEYNVPPVFGIT